MSNITGNSVHGGLEIRAATLISVEFPELIFVDVSIVWHTGHTKDLNLDHDGLGKFDPQFRGSDQTGKLAAN